MALSSNSYTRGTISISVGDQFCRLDFMQAMFLIRLIDLGLFWTSSWSIAGNDLCFIRTTHNHCGKVVFLIFLEPRDSLAASSLWVWVAVFLPPQTLIIVFFERDILGKMMMDVCSVSVNSNFATVGLWDTLYECPWTNASNVEEQLRRKNCSTNQGATPSIC